MSDAIRDTWAVLRELELSLVYSIADEEQWRRALTQMRDSLREIEASLRKPK